VTVWTPSTSIKVKVLGLAWRRGDLLLSEVEDSTGRVKGVRPLGGCIEFGETREEALVREFGEELGCAAAVSGPWHGFENIYEHEGAVGHEFVFAANITLDDPRLLKQDRFQYLESDEAACWSAWLNPVALADGVELYPAELLTLIRAGTIGPTS
jgi:8-oxo-dGTP pyrophosphatase MutT (NUDIX family)